MQKNSGKLKTETRMVVDKVSKTKKEIEELKAQLQKLINEGLKKPPEPAIVIDATPITNELPCTTKRLSTNKQPPIEESPKKTCNYDKQAAREYIKKQREMRKVQLKDQRSKVDLTQDLKKKRLQELRQKSLQLLSKSIKKKREPAVLHEVVPIIQRPIVHKNITIRCPVPAPRCLLPVVHPQEDVAKTKAAIKIQAAFRGYRQRKLYQLMLRKRTISKQVQTNNPVFLSTPTATPYPYNFLNAVRRKLNLSAQKVPLVDRADVSVQVVSQKQVDLKSFLSYKCCGSSSAKDDNGSDTSNNIPEISSESCVSNKRSHSSDDLQVKKLKGLVLGHNESIISYNRCVYPEKQCLSLKMPDLNLLDKIPVELQVMSESDCLRLVEKCDASSEPKNSTIITEEPKRLNTGNTDTLNEMENFSDKSTKCEDSKVSRVAVKDSKSKVGVSEPPLCSLQQSTVTLETKSDFNTTSEYSTQVDSNSSSIKHSDLVFDERFVTASKLNQQSDCSTSDKTLEKQLDTMPLKVPSVCLKSSSETSGGCMFSVSVSRRCSSDSETIKAVTPKIETSHSSKDNNIPDHRSSYHSITGGEAIKFVVKPGDATTLKSKVKSNEIHLKFEAELHLLNEFNESLQQVMAIEKSLVELHNNPTKTTSYETRDTQTSIVATKESTSSRNQQIPSINYSRGCEFVDETNTSFITSGLEISQINESFDNTKENNESISPYIQENLVNVNVRAGLSLEMFEQLIKDEDVRIENLKAILKIREKSLVDRTKGELAWLEVQKRHLRDSGQIQEISAIKKKQRGLLIKLEHERHEMQRLKQMQKAASKERKLVLKEQRNNMIKGQLSTSIMSTKIKRTAKEYKRASGPLKVYNIRSCSESIVSETSVSKQSSICDEINSVVSHSQSIVSHINEETVGYSKLAQNEGIVSIAVKPPIETECVKKSLLIREAALHKRRKAAEELLQWHQRLLEEEEKIAQLELAAVAIINQMPAVTNSSRHKFKGSQLNLLWHNMTGRNENKFNDSVVYSMSRTALQQFCTDAKKCATVGSGEYTSDFEVVSNEIKQTQVEDTTIDEDLPDDRSEHETVITSLHEQNTVSVEESNSSQNEDSVQRKNQISSTNSSNANEIKEQVDISIKAYTTLQRKSVSEDCNNREMSTDTNEEESINKMSTKDVLSNVDQIKTETFKSLQTSPSNDSPKIERIKSTDTDSITKFNTTQTNDHNIRNATKPEKLAMEILSVLESPRNDTTNEINSETTSNDETSKQSSKTVPNSDSTEQLLTNCIENAASLKTNEESKVTVSAHSEVETKSTKNDSKNSKSIIMKESLKINELTNLNSLSEVISKTNENNYTNEDSSSKIIEPNKTVSSTDKVDSVSFVISINEEKTKSKDKDTNESCKTLQTNEITISNEIIDSPSEVKTKTTNNSYSNIQTNHDNNSEALNTNKTINSTVQIDSTANSSLDESKTVASEDIITSRTVEEITSLSKKIDSQNETNRKDDSSIKETEYSNKIIEQCINLRNKHSYTAEDATVAELDEIVESEEGSVGNSVSSNKINSKICENSDSSIKTSNDSKTIIEEATEMVELLNLSKENDINLFVADFNNVKGKTSELIYTSTENITEIEDALNSNKAIETSNQVINTASDSSSTNSNKNETVEATGDNINDYKDRTESNIKTLKEITNNEEISTTTNNKILKTGDSKHCKIESGSNKACDVSKVETENEITKRSENKLGSEPLKLISTKTVDEDDINTFDNTSKIDITLSYDNVPDIESHLDTKTETKIKTVEKIEAEVPKEDDVSETSDRTDKSIKTLISEECNVTSPHVNETEINNNDDNAEEFSHRKIETSDNDWTDVETSTDDKSNPSNLTENKIDADQMQGNESDSNTNLEDNKENLTDDASFSYGVLERKVDVKKRVSEILTDANILSPRSDKSPRLQDLYVTAYDIADDEIKDGEVSPVKQIDDEVQQLLKKQLEIENEIKKIQQQQQKEQLPYLYVREIPNKPPPPYIPPVTAQTPTGSILPSNEKHLASITTTIASILYSAHSNRNLHNITLSPEYKHQTSFEFIFDLCKEAANEHYEQFEEENGALWMNLTKRTKLAIGKPFNQNNLNAFLLKKMRQRLGYDTIKSTENIKRKWSSKKRDHVDELLVVECQEEESEWINYDKDEIVVKEELCKDLMNMLISETTQMFSNILNKKTFLY